MFHTSQKISNESPDTEHIPATDHTADANHHQDIMDNVRDEGQAALHAMNQVNNTPTLAHGQPQPGNAPGQPQPGTASNTQQESTNLLQDAAKTIRDSAFGKLVERSKTLQHSEQNPSTDSIAQHSEQNPSTHSTANKALGILTKVQNVVGTGTSGIMMLTNGTSAAGGIAEATITPTTDNEKTINDIKATNEAVSMASLLLRAWTAFTSFTGGILAVWNSVKQAEQKSENGLSFREIMKVSILSSFSQFLTTLLSITNLASKLPKSKTAQVMLATLSDIGLAALPLLNAAIKFSGLQKRMSDMKKEQSSSSEVANATKDYYTYLTKQRNRQIGSMALAAPILALKMVSAALQWTMQFAPKNSVHAARAKKGLAITKILSSATSAVKSGVDTFFATSTLSGSREEASQNYERFMALTTPNIYINDFFNTNNLLNPNVDQTQLENSIKEYQHVQKCMELFQIPIPAMHRATSQKEQKEIFFSAFGLSPKQDAASSNSESNAQTA